MKKLLTKIITDAAHGDHVPLAGLLDWLMHDHDVSVPRLKKIAWLHFGIPAQIVESTILKLCF